MSRFIRLFVLLFLCGWVAQAWADTETAPQQSASAENADGVAELIVLNISGPTLFASNQDITDNGTDLVSLPRGTYKRVRIAAGSHEFRFRPFPRGRRVATLEAEAGRTYYLVVGYSPGKSWAFPMGGDPMTIKVVGEEIAEPLMKEMKEE